MRGVAAGVGLIEVVIAITLTSIGILGAAGVVAGIGSQARRAAWDAERALAARATADRLRRVGFAQAVSGTDSVSVGGRAHTVIRTATARAPRLRHIALSVAPPGGSEATFEILIAPSRPQPGAP